MTYLDSSMKCVLLQNLNWNPLQNERIIIKDSNQTANYISSIAYINTLDSPFAYTSFVNFKVIFYFSMRNK